MKLEAYLCLKCCSKNQADLLHCLKSAKDPGLQQEAQKTLDNLPKSKPKK
jgi:hypothetical protein